jgi:hypothetical protein
VENKDALTAEKINQQILSPFLQVMDLHKGLTLDALLNSLEKELKANKTDTFKGSTRTFTDERKIATQTDEVIYSKPMVDWQTRQKARKDALAYRGIIAAEKMQVDHSGSVTVETGIRRPGDGDDGQD